MNLLQKESEPSCCGNFSTGVRLENASKESLAKLTKLLIEENEHKPKA